MATILQDGTIKDIKNISNSFFSLLPNKKLSHKKRYDTNQIRPKITIARSSGKSSKKSAPSNIDASIENSANIDSSTNVASGENSEAQMGSIVIK